MGTFTFDGRRVHWRERGEGPLLLVLPGSTASSAHHEGELTHFGRAWRAVAFDPPGTGASDRIERWPDDWWGYAAAAAAELIDHLGGAPAVLVGTSGGAITALIAAAEHPDRVRAVIADSAVPRYDPDFLRRAAVLRRIQTAAMVDFWRVGHGDDWEQVVTADGDFLERVGARGGDAFDGRLERVRCPVLFTGSLGDDLVSGIGPGALEMAARVPGAQVFLTREGGHPMIWTRADAFRRAADAFLASVAQSVDCPT